MMLSHCLLRTAIRKSTVASVTIDRTLCGWSNANFNRLFLCSFSFIVFGWVLFSASKTSHFELLIGYKVVTHCCKFGFGDLNWTFVRNVNDIWVTNDFFITLEILCKIYMRQNIEKITNFLIFILSGLKPYAIYMLIWNLVKQRVSLCI